jgi:hypothetical protein
MYPLWKAKSDSASHEILQFLWSQIKGSLSVHKSTPPILNPRHQKPIHNVQTFSLILTVMTSSHLSQSLFCDLFHWGFATKMWHSSFLNFMQRNQNRLHVHINTASPKITINYCVRDDRCFFSGTWLILLSVGLEKRQFLRKFAPSDTVIS